MDTTIQISKNDGWRVLAGAAALLFGAATLIEGGHTLFGERGADVVLFVLVFNFAAGFLYVGAGIGTLGGQRWAIWIARALAVSSLAVFIALAAHIASGGGFMPKTVVAMTLRSGFWLAQALLLPKLLPK